MAEAGGTFAIRPYRRGFRRMSEPFSHYRTSDTVRGRWGWQPQVSSIGTAWLAWVRVVCSPLRVHRLTAYPDSDVGFFRVDSRPEGRLPIASPGTSPISDSSFCGRLHLTGDVSSDGTADCQSASYSAVTRQGGISAAMYLATAITPFHPVRGVEATVHRMGALYHRGTSRVNRRDAV